MGTPQARWYGCPISTRVRAIELFGDHHPHQAVRPGQRRERPAEIRRGRQAGIEAIRPADEERKVLAARHARREPLGERGRRHRAAADLERDDVVGGADRGAHALGLARERDLDELELEAAAEAPRVFLDARVDPRGQAGAGRDQPDAHGALTSGELGARRAGRMSQSFSSP